MSCRNSKNAQGKFWPGVLICLKFFTNLKRALICVVEIAKFVLILALLTWLYLVVTSPVNLFSLSPFSQLDSAVAILWITAWLVGKYRHS